MLLFDALFFCFLSLRSFVRFIRKSQKLRNLKIFSTGGLKVNLKYPNFFSGKNVNKNVNKNVLDLTKYFFTRYIKNRYTASSNKFYYFFDFSKN